MNTCDFGCGNPANFYFKTSKKWCCEKSPNSCPAKRQADSQKKKGINPWENKEHPRGMLGKKPVNTGLSFDQFFGEEKSKEIKLKMSKKLKNKPSNWHEFDEVTKNKIRENMKKNRIGGYIKGSGRGKSGWYKGFWCDSSWELAWVIYNIEHGITFARNRERYEYSYNGKIFKYCPDFILGEKLIEIKAYFDAQNIEKIKQCPVFITIIDKHSIKPYIQYAIQRYGKDYIKLYEKSKSESIIS
jgi:hypothetical protein